MCEEFELKSEVSSINYVEVSELGTKCPWRILALGANCPDTSAQ